MIGNTKSRKPPCWPQAELEVRKTTNRRKLVKTVALILAEIERIDRAGGEA